MKIFITGGNGYVGSNLIFYLSKKNYQITTLVKKKPKKKIANVKYIVGKLNNNYKEYLKNTDLIIHCAAAGVYKNTSKKKIFKVNYEDSVKFFNIAYNQMCRNWIVLGTSSEYGYVEDKSLSSKKSPLNPINDYGKSKVKFFKFINKKKFKANCKILYLRLFHVYGANERKGRLYRDLIDCIKKNKNFKMTSGEEIRDFICIKKVINKIYKSFSLFKTKKLFLVKHIASGTKTKVRDFAEYHWKKNNCKKKILVGKLKRKNIYNSMYSDKLSIIK
jgi:nucleoside-diphosphate-sugar epimerase